MLFCSVAVTSIFNHILYFLQCEKDFYKEDGTTCLGGQAYCTGGACVTRESACKAVFGKSTKIRL